MGAETLSVADAGQKCRQEGKQYSSTAGRFAMVVRAVNLATETDAKSEQIVKNIKNISNLLLAFLFGIFLTIDLSKGNKLPWPLILVALLIGIWLTRFDPPWSHGFPALVLLAAGHLCANAWLNVHHLRLGLIWDGSLSMLVAAALLSYGMDLGKLRRQRSSAEADGPRPRS